jgi:hypothetical protein
MSPLQPRLNLSVLTTRAKSVEAILKAVTRSIQDLILFCGLGALCAVCVGLLVFLRLGLPARPHDAGYISGLFWSQIRPLRLDSPRDPRAFLAFRADAGSGKSQEGGQLTMRILVNEGHNRPTIR